MLHLHFHSQLQRLYRLTTYSLPQSTLTFRSRALPLLTSVRPLQFPTAQIQPHLALSLRLTCQVMLLTAHALSAHLPLLRPLLSLLPSLHLQSCSPCSPLCATCCCLSLPHSVVSHAILAHPLCMACCCPAPLMPSSATLSSVTPLSPVSLVPTSLSAPTPPPTSIYRTWATETDNTYELSIL